MAEMVTMPNISARTIMRAAVAGGAVPGTAEMLRTGEVRWHDRAFVYVGWVESVVSGHLSCALNIGDARFEDVLSRFGGITVWIRAAQDNSITWPTEKKLNETQLLYLGRQFQTATEFVRDRHDLARLLATRGNVSRDDYYAWLPDNNFPARLVKAMILSRDLEDPQLESEIAAILRPDPSSANGMSDESLAVAKGWAKQYSKALGKAIHLP
jgi:hypothetical protein